MEQFRLDVYLHLNEYAESREKAKQLILDGLVIVNGKIINKPSAKVTKGCSIEITKVNNYVGRGYLKIEKAFNMFNINIEGSTVVDVGASTGGFTDYLLQHGAKKVYAVDVGHDQLHEKLKNDSRVVNLEGTNFRHINIKIFEDAVDIITVDVSFISIIHIIPKIVEISRECTNIVILIKPQFEAGKDYLGKNGIVKDKKIHLMVLNKVNDYCNTHGLYIDNVTYSPIKGGNGNIEYLAHLKKGNISKLNSEHFKGLIWDAFDLL